MFSWRNQKNINTQYVFMEKSEKNINTLRVKTKGLIFIYGEHYVSLNKVFFFFPIRKQVYFSYHSKTCEKIRLDHAVDDTPSQNPHALCHVTDRQMVRRMDRLALAHLYHEGKSCSKFG